jgi:putative Holliday junction resolvase
MFKGIRRNFYVEKIFYTVSRCKGTFFYAFLRLQCVVNFFFPFLFFNFADMGRLMAIDYGKKRVGVAVSDPSQIIANGLTTVASGEVFKFLTDYLSKEVVDVIVVGLPKTMQNEESESMKYIKPFVEGLKKRFPNIPVEMHDERFTSVLAHRAMLDGGLKKMDRRNKALVDEISATIILQSYMEAKRNLGF